MHPYYTPSHLKKEEEKKHTKKKTRGPGKNVWKHIGAITVFFFPLQCFLAKSKDKIKKKCLQKETKLKIIPECTYSHRLFKKKFRGGGGGGGGGGGNNS